MGFIALQSWSRGVSSSVHLLRPVGPNPNLFDDVRQVRVIKPGFKFDVRSFSSRKSLKKLKRHKDIPKTEDEEVAQVSPTRFEEAQVDDSATSKDPIDVVVASRDKVLQACTVTSGLMAALGLIIRKASHVASTQGLPVPDCSTDIPFGFETWHLGLIAGIVVLISSSRFVLLNSWPDFADSSEAANRQEILFRGGLMPLLGTNWTGIVAVGLIFGFLHLGSGRKYSFAVWASIVGIVYGYAAVLSSSLVVPMASHALNNLVGGLLWRHTSKLKSLE